MPEEFDYGGLWKGEHDVRVTDRVVIEPGTCAEAEVIIDHTNVPEGVTVRELDEFFRASIRTGPAQWGINSGKPDGRIEHMLWRNGHEPIRKDKPVFAGVQLDNLSTQRIIIQPGTRLSRYFTVDDAKYRVRGEELKKLVRDTWTPEGDYIYIAGQRGEGWDYDYTIHGTTREEVGLVVAIDKSSCRYIPHRPKEDIIIDDYATGRTVRPIIDQRMRKLPERVTALLMVAQTPHMRLPRSHDVIIASEVWPMLIEDEYVRLGFRRQINSNLIDGSKPGEDAEVFRTDQPVRLEVFGRFQRNWPRPEFVTLYVYPSVNYQMRVKQSLHQRLSLI